MIEIVILVFLAIKTGKLAKKKGLKQNAWITYTVLCWIGGEVIGMVAGLAIFDKTNLFSIMLMGLAGAIGGYFIVKHQLDKLPDNTDDDINRIGVNDLYPDKK